MQARAHSFHGIAAGVDINTRRAMNGSDATAIFLSQKLVGHEPSTGNRGQHPQNAQPQPSFAMDDSTRAMLTKNEQRHSPRSCVLTGASRRLR